jgi:hypothetical protein
MREVPYHGHQRKERCRHRDWGKPALSSKYQLARCNGYIFEASGGRTRKDAAQMTGFDVQSSRVLCGLVNGNLLRKFSAWAL